MAALLPTGPFTLQRPSPRPLPPASKNPSWPKADLIKYAVFLDFFKSTPSLNLEQWSSDWSFFRRLSLFLQSKNPNQCRIFHKQMLAQHLSLELLIAHLREHIELFEEWASNYAPALVNLARCLAREGTAKPQMQLQTAVETPSHFGQPLNCFRLGEKDKEEQKPTQADYNDEEEEEEQPRRRPALPHIISRPSFSLPSFDESSNFNLALDFPILSRPKEMALGMESSKQDQWEDCHKSFLNYMGKVNALMKATPSQF